MKALDYLVLFYASMNNGSRQKKTYNQSHQFCFVKYILDRLGALRGGIRTFQLITKVE